ncbi:hypothetical protein TNCV_3237351 [Trichonephila clavipes]|nr:hypothetical protein TNCV_3237351 [Trichonephila clavipes]
MNLVILDHGQVTRTTPELTLPSPNYHTNEITFKLSTENVHLALIRRRWFVVRRILYKGTLAPNPRCRRRRRIDEADISTHVAIDQCTVNYLEEVIRSFTAMRSSVDRRVLT